MKQLHLTALVELPEDLFEASEVICSVKGPWEAALDTLKNRPGLVFRDNAEVLEVRAKTPRKPRKPRLVPPTLDEAQGILKGTAA